MKRSKQVERDNTRRQERVTAEERRRRRGSRDGGTHSKSDGLDWHACWPSTLFLYVFCFLSRTQLSFSCCPLQVPRYRARRPPSNVNTDAQLTHTHTNTHTWVSMVGGETCGGCGWRGRGARGGGFISGGMLSVSKDTHFTHTGQKHTAHPHRRSSCLRPPSLLDHFYLSNLIYPCSRFF